MHWSAWPPSRPEPSERPGRTTPPRRPRTLPRCPASTPATVKVVAKRPRFVLAPCRPPAALRKGVCVTDVVRTVVLPALPAPTAPPHSPVPSASVPLAPSAGTPTRGGGDDEADHEDEVEHEDDAEHEHEDEAEHEDEDHEVARSPRSPRGPDVRRRGSGGPEGQDRTSTRVPPIRRRTHRQGPAAAGRRTTGDVEAEAGAAGPEHLGEGLGDARPRRLPPSRRTVPSPLSSVTSKVFPQGVGEHVVDHHVDEVGEVQTRGHGGP